MALCSDNQRRHDGQIFHHHGGKLHRSGIGYSASAFVIGRTSLYRATRDSLRCHRPYNRILAGKHQQQAASAAMKRPLPPVRWSRCQKAYGTRFSFATLRGHTRSSQSQSTVTKTSLVFFDQQFGSLLNTQIESLAANRYGDGDVNAATFSRRVTQVPHTSCRLFSSLQLQVCLRLSGSIVPRWSHLISVF
jgi:hypothetical protein